MRFTKSILRTIPFDRSRFGAAWKSAAIRMDGKVADAPYPWKYQFKLFVSILLALWSIPFRLRSARNARLIYYDNVNSPQSLAQRRYFLKKHLRIDAPDEALLLCDGQSAFPPIYFNKLSLAKAWTLHRIAWRLVWAAFAGLFGKTRVHWMWKRTLAHSLIQQLAFHDPEKPQVFFFSYEPHTYLGSFIGSHLIPRHHPILISSNSLLLRGNRYQYNPKVDFKLCSTVLQEESACYIQNGWMEFRSVETWGLEEALVLDQIPPEEPTVDIGIYSSGSWARTMDLWRSGDIEQIRAYAYLANPMYTRFLPILEAIVTLKKETGCSAKVYFHPFEKMLMDKHGIVPPYLKLLEENGILYEQEGKTSLENFYESRIGVSISSTILFDRLHMGLASLYFDGAGIPMYTIAEQYMGKYRDLCFHDMEELKEKIRQQL